MAEYRTIFFDAGGTLIHVDRTYILGCLADNGVACDEATLAAAQGAAAQRVAAVVRSDDPGDDATRWALYLRVMLERLDCRGEAADAVAATVRERHAEGRLWSDVRPGTRETLDELRERGYRLGIISNADGRVESFLEAAGLREPFDLVIDSGIVGFEKPDPAIFWMACNRADTLPSEALHVGDVYDIDVVGASRAGVDAVLLDPTDRLVDADCPRIGALSDLPRWIEGAVASA